MKEKRYAIVTPGAFASIDVVRNYLPQNYSATPMDTGEILVSGFDDHGWTLDGYVIPRLGSGLIAAREVDAEEGGR